MSEKPTSLLEPVSAPPLFSSDEWQRLEKGGEFTGQRLFDQRPDAYRGIVHALGQGMGIRATSRAFSVSTNTVYAVLEREGVAIDTLKTETVKQLQRAAAVGAERIADHLENGAAKLGELSIATGIVIDKLQLLSGEATQRIEHRVVPSHDDINRFLDSLPVAQTVSDGGKETQQGGLAALPAPAETVALVPVKGEVLDLQSTNSPFKAGSDTSIATDLRARSVELTEAQHGSMTPHTLPDPRPGTSAPGGGGGANATEGVVYHTDSSLPQFQQGEAS